MLSEIQSEPGLDKGPAGKEEKKKAAANKEPIHSRSINTHESGKLDVH